MRRSAAVVTSVVWFVLTGGVGAVLVPWWLTGWRAGHPFPYWGVAQAVGILLIVAGLIPPLHVFVQFVRAGGTPMPGAVTTRLVVNGFNRYVRNPIYLGAVTIFVGEALLLGRLNLLLYAVAAWAGVAAFVRWYVYQLHRPDPDTDIEETLSALTDLQRAGKIRAFGTSSLPASEIVRAHWVSERRGLARLRTEQPVYSILNRGIEREVLPVTQEFGMGTLVWSPLGGGLLTGRYRKGQEAATHRSRYGFQHLKDDRRLDVVEQLIPLAEEAGMPLTHLAMAFVLAHPGVTSALTGPRTMAHLDDLLAGVEVTLDDDLLDRIDKIVPPGTEIGTLDMAYQPPAVERADLRRRPLSDRAAA